jgi:hypothetical protein
MNCERTAREGEGMTRRTFLGALTMLLGGALAGCSTLSLVLGTYPDKYDRDGNLREFMLAMFVCTVIPDAQPDEPHLTEVFGDDFYPFHEYSGYFLSVLAGASQDLYGHDSFHLLDLESRTKVVESCLDKSGPAGRLTTTAVFMAQFSYYGGIYDDDRGCALIDFPGANDGYRPNTMSRNEISNHMARETTTDGNPA